MSRMQSEPYRDALILCNAINLMNWRVEPCIKLAQRWIFGRATKKTPSIKCCSEIESYCTLLSTVVRVASKILCPCTFERHTLQNSSFNALIRTDSVLSNPRCALLIFHRIPLIEKHGLMSALSNIGYRPLCQEFRSSKPNCSVRRSVYDGSQIEPWKVVGDIYIRGPEEKSLKTEIFSLVSSVQSFLIIHSQFLFQL